MLDSVTPVLLTFNEEPNIRRTLGQLDWARDVVLVDSFSTDATVDIAREDGRVRVFQRAFDSHARQWNYALEQVESDWVLSLDADYFVTDELIAEIAALTPDHEAYLVDLRFQLVGRVLRSSILPPRPVLFRRGSADYFDDGHTQRLRVHGETGHLRHPIIHDDRKPLDHWLAAQVRYSALEARKLLATEPSDLTWSGKIRRLRVVAPFAVPLYCLLLRGGIFEGRAGIYYALQKMMAEVLLSLRLVDLDTRADQPPEPE